MKFFMLPSLNETGTSQPRSENKLEAVRGKLARAMVGSEVDVLAADHKTIAHGVVASVFSLAGTSKIVVNGRLYDMEQVLTATHGAPSFTRPDLTTLNSTQNYL